MLRRLTKDKSLMLPLPDQEPSVDPSSFEFCPGDLSSSFDYLFFENFCWSRVAKWLFRADCFNKRYNKWFFTYQMLYCLKLCSWSSHFSDWIILGCKVAFCSKQCLNNAVDQYHIAVCTNGKSSIIYILHVMGSKDMDSNCNKSLVTNHFRNAFFHT